MERHSDDATSTALWVEEMRSNEDANHILLYKPQGKTHQQLEVGYFCLAIQAPLQATNDDNLW